MDAIITRLIEIGCFNTAGLNSYDAVLQADARQAVKVLSIKNAGA